MKKNKYTFARKTKIPNEHALVLYIDTFDRQYCLNTLLNNSRLHFGMHTSGKYFNISHWKQQY